MSMIGVACLIAVVQGAPVEKQFQGRIFLQRPDTLQRPLPPAAHATGPRPATEFGPPAPAKFRHRTEPGGDLAAGLRSLAVPGWGQKHRERSYWWIYPVIEAVAWVGWIEAHGTGGARRDRYRDLAWGVARSPLWSGDRMEGPWEYYERMGQWAASGVYDRSTDPTRLAPETDAAKYNGWVWELARDLHPGEPGYDAAIEYYRERAVRPEFQWDWGGDAEARQRFRGLVQASDDAYRRATTFVGVIFLNHFLSATEAWLQGRSDSLAAAPIRLGTRIIPMAGRRGWGLEIRIQRNSTRRTH